MKIKFKILTLSPSPNGSTYVTNNPNLSTDMQVLIRAISIGAQQPEMTYVSVELYTFDAFNTYISKGVLTVDIEGLHPEYTQDVKMLIANKLYAMGLIDSPTDFEDTLQVAKDDRWAYIVAMRDTLESRGFKYLGHTFDSDAVSVMRILGLATAAQSAQALGETMYIDWTTADNEVVTLDVPKILGLSIALSQFSNSLHVKAKSYKEVINSAESVEEVNAIIWE